MTNHRMAFSDTFTSLEFRFSLGNEASANRRYLSIPVSNGLVDYEEHYAIEDADFHAWMREPSAALPMVIRCRRRQMDHALMMPPGTNRGASGERGFSVAEVATMMGLIAALLRDGHCPSWASGIEAQRARLAHSSDEVRRNILGMYGGMGSICDLVLYRDGVLLRQATDELHELLGWLHEWGARLV